MTAAPKEGLPSPHGSRDPQPEEQHSGCTANTGLPAAVPSEHHNAFHDIHNRAAWPAFYLGTPQWVQ
jgi:hypothetical protein